LAKHYFHPEAASAAGKYHWTRTQYKSEKINEMEFSSTNEIETTLPSEQDEGSSIMECLSAKCQEAMDSCLNDTECNEFVGKWQQQQHQLSDDQICAPSTKRRLKEGEIAETPNQCEYGALFLNVYHCGDVNECYDGRPELISAASQNIESPSNFRVNPDNIVGSESSSSYFTLVVVALTSGISAVIFVEVIRRLYNALKDKCSGNQCANCANSLIVYLQNKWASWRGWKYEKTHEDLTIIEKELDEEMYGNDVEIENEIDAKYKGVIKSDSDSSDDDKTKIYDPFPSKHIDDTKEREEFSEPEIDDAL